MLNDALRVIRNEIHDVAPAIVPFKKSTERVGLAFHVDVGTRVMSSLSVLSDDRSSGIRQAFADGHLVDPHLFHELVLPWMLRSVDDVLQALLTRLPDRPTDPGESWLAADVLDASIRAIAHAEIR